MPRVTLGYLGIDPQTCQVPVYPGFGNLGIVINANARYIRGEYLLSHDARDWFPASHFPDVNIVPTQYVDRDGLTYYGFNFANNELKFVQVLATFEWEGDGEDIVQTQIQNEKGCSRPAQGPVGSGAILGIGVPSLTPSQASITMESRAGNDLPNNVWVPAFNLLYLQDEGAAGSPHTPAPSTWSMVHGFRNSAPVEHILVRMRGNLTGK